MEKAAAYAGTMQEQNGCNIEQRPSYRDPHSEPRGVHSSVLCTATHLPFHVIT